MATNKIVIGLVSVLGLAVVVVGINAFNRPDAPALPSANQSAENAKKAVNPVSKTADGDTVNETIKTVKAGYETTKSESEDLKTDVKALKAEIEKLKSAKQNPLQVGGAPKVDVENAVNDVSEEFDEIGKGAKEFASNFKTKKNVTEKNNTGVTPYAVQPTATALNGYEVNDAELGLSTNSNMSAAEKQKAALIAQQSHLPGYVTVKSMTNDSNNTLSGNINLKGFRDTASSAMNSLGQKAGDASHDIKNTVSQNAQPLMKNGKKGGVVTPHFTIPVRSTLFNAVSMTALIGTVPVGGKVNDPFPVKMIIGDNNLATNGLRIPGLRGIVFEGVARGNWNLSCVSVALTGATFTFDDGRVQHMGHDHEEGGEDTKESEAKSPFNGSSGGNNSLGYISNPQGVPCIPGKRVTDADKQLFTIGTLGAAKSFFDARAAAQTSTQSGGLLGSTTSVTGDKEKFINNKTYADSVGLVMDFYNKRMRDSFDVIYADPATPIVLHITKDLKVDYNTGNRKLAYGFGDKNETSMD